MTLTITCIVGEMGRFDIARVSRVFEGQEAEISTNQFLSTDVSDTGRYKHLGHTANGDENTYKIQITDLRGADGGRITCAKMPGGRTAMEDITVKVSPQSVNLYYLNANGERVEVEEGGKLVLAEDTRSTVICEAIVNGTETKATMQVDLGERDITNQFKKEETYDRELKNTFLNIVRVQTLKWVMDKPNIDNNGKTVECSAQLPDFPAKTTTATIEVKYRPKLECDTRWSAKIGSKDVRIACRGRMHPGPTRTSFSYGQEADGTHQVIQVGEKFNNLTVEQTNLGPNEWEFSLAISEVSPEHFQRYKLEVHNEVGSDATNIRFHEEEEEVEINTPAPTQNVLDITKNEQGSDGIEQGKGYEFADEVRGSAQSNFATHLGTCLLFLAARLL